MMDIVFCRVHAILQWQKKHQQAFPAALQQINGQEQNSEVQVVGLL